MEASGTDRSRQPKNCRTPTFIANPQRLAQEGCNRPWCNAIAGSPCKRDPTALPLAGPSALTLQDIGVISGIMDMLEHDVNRRIAGRVRDLRAARGLTLDALAERSGVSRSMISLIERGESSPTAALLERLAAGLNVS